jgi:short-subunit dehydrogenase
MSFLVKSIFFTALIISILYFVFFNKRTLIAFTNKKVIIIGATSGIGEALAKELAKRGALVGLTGRRKHLLEKISSEIPTKSFIKQMDIAQAEQAQAQLKELITEMGGMDILIINAAVGNCDLSWEKQKEIIDINVLGFTAMASVATDYFIQQGHGHLVGISSLLAVRGSSAAPTYSASKAYVSNYLHGLRGRFMKLNKEINVTTIEPGLVWTAMRGSCGADREPSDFWRATPQEAAQQIADAIEKKRKHAYVTKRWRLIAWAMKLMPESLFYKLF